MCVTSSPLLRCWRKNCPPPVWYWSWVAAPASTVRFSAGAFRACKWQPSELADRIAGINAWRAKARCHNFLPPLILDVAQDLWPIKQVDAVFSANLVHFIGWNKVRSMLGGVRRVLKKSGLAVFYGPFNYGGKFTSDGNRRLDPVAETARPGVRH